MKVRLVWISLVACAAACAPDPDEDFKRFERRVDERVMNEPDGGPGSDGPDCEQPATASDLVGTYIFAVVPTFATNVKIMSKLTIHTVSDDGHEASVSVQLVTQEEPHVPVGAVNEGTLTIEDGQFKMDTITYDIPAAANPAGFDGRTTLSFHGKACSPGSGELGSFCGTADGTVIAPLTAPYDGSTFAALRSQDGTTLPTPLGSCADLEQMK